MTEKKKGRGGNAKPSIEKYRKLYGDESSLRHEARMEIVAEIDRQIAKLEKIAFNRYKKKGGLAVEGQLFLTALKARREMLGVDAPSKTAFTDPTGQKQYDGVTDKELLKRFEQIQSDMNVSKDTG